jgi:hypothetical protein
VFTLTISLDSLAVYIVAADILILLSYVLYILNKKRLREKSIKHITDFVEEYFLNTGAQVHVTCFKLEGNRRFIVLIQSQALKRFRCSNILESNLITHIYEITGNTVDKIYWRFPVVLNKDTVEEESRAEPDDLYFSDVRATTETANKYNVSEVPWDQFDEPRKSRTAQSEPD